MLAQDADWTRGAVEQRLVAAFRRMPSCPVYARAGRPRAASARAASTAISPAIAWVELLERDPDARVVLWAWARCRATGESFAALCRAMGWPQQTAEAARRRAAAAIATALNELASNAETGASAASGCAGET